MAHVLNNFGWYMLLVELPMFLSDGLGFEIKEAGLIIRQNCFDQKRFDIKTISILEYKKDSFSFIF